MAYQELGEVKVVVLGGVDKQTKKRNPTELEGYLLRVEKRPNRFNPDKPQNFYVFQTPRGEEGTYGKAGIDSVLRNAVLGAMTKLVATGEVLDTGKGNPMKVFKAYQDTSNTIDVHTPAVAQAIESSEGTSEAGDESDDSDLFDDNETSLDEVVAAKPARAAAPAPARAINTNRVQELIAKSKSLAAGRG